MKTHPVERSLLLILISLALSLMTAQATAIYTNQAAFLAATQPGYYLETFNSLPLGTIPPTLPPPLNFSKNGFSYSATTASGNDFFPFIGPSGDEWLSTFHEFDPIIFNFTSNNVTAVGGNLFMTDLNGK